MTIGLFRQLLVELEHDPILHGAEVFVRDGHGKLGRAGLEVHIVIDGMAGGDTVKGLDMTRRAVVVVLT